MTGCESLQHTVRIKPHFMFVGRYAQLQVMRRSSGPAPLRRVTRVGPLRNYSARERLGSIFVRAGVYATFTSAHVFVREGTGSLALMPGMLLEFELGASRPVSRALIVCRLRLKLRWRRRCCGTRTSAGRSKADELIACNVTTVGGGPIEIK
jgi:hypothetical protein